MPFCAYCGSLLEDGQVCKCRNQGSSANNSASQKFAGSSTPLDNEIDKLRNSAKKDVNDALKERALAEERERLSYADLESPFGVPSFNELIIIAFVLISLIMLVVPWWTQKGNYGDMYHHNIFYSDIFSASALLGIAKVCGIINIISFIAILISSFFDINVLVPAVKDVDVKRICGFVYFGFYAFALIFTFIGFIAGGELIGLGIGWFFALAIAIIAFVCWWKPDLIEQTTKKQ